MLPYSLYALPPGPERVRTKTHYYVSILFSFIIPTDAYTESPHSVRIQIETESYIFDLTAKAAIQIKGNVEHVEMEDGTDAFVAKILVGPGSELPSPRESAVTGVQVEALNDIEGEEFAIGSPIAYLAINESSMESFWELEREKGAAREERELEKTAVEAKDVRVTTTKDGKGKGTASETPATAAPAKPETPFSVGSWLAAVQAEYDVSADLRSLYASALDDAGFDSLAGLESLSKDDLTELGVKKGHARVLLLALAEDEGKREKGE